MYHYPNTDVSSSLVLLSNRKLFLKTSTSCKPRKHTQKYAKHNKLRLCSIGKRVNLKLSHWSVAEKPRARHTRTIPHRCQSSTDFVAVLRPFAVTQLWRYVRTHLFIFFFYKILLIPSKSSISSAIIMIFYLLVS